jgi:membrane protease YdiL (CAAX protease family)
VNQRGAATIGLRAFGLVWRLVLYTALLIVGIRGLSMLVKAGLHLLGVHFAHPDGAHPVEALILNQLVILVAAVLANAVLMRTDQEGAPPMLPLSALGGVRFLKGLFWGVAGVAVLLGIIALMGAYRITGLAHSGPALAKYAALWAGAAAINGLAENLAVLGYPLLRAAKTVGFVPAIFLVSTLFAAAHLGNPGETPTGLASVLLTALLFAASVWRSGDLWLSVGIHAGLVFAEDFLFAVPDSGEVYTGHLISSQFSGPDWLTGGAAGPEGSILSFPLLVAGLALLWFAYPKPASRQVPASIEAKTRPGISRS